MGQMVGRMPDKWDDLMKEKDRVLYWSGEVLAKVSDNINEEDSLLAQHGSQGIYNKIETWMELNRVKIDSFFNEHQGLAEMYRNLATYKLAQVRELTKLRMAHRYRRSYKGIRKLTKKIDKLGERQRKIHEKIQGLEYSCDGNVEKFRAKFGRLRVKTFENLRIGEILEFQDKKLKRQFAKDIDHVDRMCKKKCLKYMDKWIQSIEKTDND